ncbi:ATP-binding protein [Ammoniphilus sp. CFH 90114]|uniref:ATP-binding protein n=1 Tax=Ammoniphilus sp. CFH 90114 TaxID=2493665 RepID=UPI0013E94A84|nr:ATP-binding protein [Ammoniphilus sp. CFH 90114]
MLKYLLKECKVLIKDILHNRKNKDSFVTVQEQLTDLIREQQGMTFVVKKDNGQFIHTLCDGELLYRLGFTPRAIVGKPLESFLPLDFARYKEEFYERAWQGEEHVEYEGTLNGITYLASLRPLRREGATVAVVASCVDITKLKETEELLRKSETLSVVGQLAASMAHEIRNPLTTLKGFLQLYQEASQVNAKHFQVIMDEVDHINFIVSELLYLTNSNTQYHDTSILDILQTTIKLMRMQGNMTNIQIELEVSQSPPIVSCDPNQIKQVFINLIKNAMDSMPLGGTVKIQLASNHQYALISFRDDGCGIPEDRIPRLGEPFYSTKERGAGLGLLVCKNIIHNHQGTISFSSKVDEGTLVKVLLPLNSSKQPGVQSSIRGTAIKV